MCIDPCTQHRYVPGVVCIALQWTIVQYWSLGCLTSDRVEGGFRTTAWRPQVEDTVGREPGVAACNRATGFTIR